MGFVLFLSILGIVYIFNAHKAEGKMRSIQELRREVLDAKNQYQQIKSEIMFESTESQLEKELISKDLKSNDDVPVIIKQDNS